jgi:hypothetical protein
MIIEIDFQIAETLYNYQNSVRTHQSNLKFQRFTFHIAKLNRKLMLSKEYRCVYGISLI